MITMLARSTANRILDAGGWRLEAGGWKLEDGSQRSEAGGKETGSKETPWADSGDKIGGLKFGFEI
jgi:hypothetical protein